jgi:hypothetical protein
LCGRVVHPHDLINLRDYILLSTEDIHFSSKNLVYFKRNTADRPHQLENVIQINKINEGKLYPQSSETPLLEYWVVVVKPGKILYV